MLLIPDTNCTNSIQSLLQCPFERRTLAEKLKVKELGSDQPDGLIYCEELFVELCAAPPQKIFFFFLLYQNKMTLDDFCHRATIKWMGIIRRP